MRKKELGKVATKKKLLEKIQKDLENQRGYSPSLNEVIIYLAESYLNDMRLSPKQLQKIEEASQSAKLSREQVLSKACDWAYRFYSHRFTNERPAKPEEESHPGSAYWRIDKFVKKLMDKNDKAKSKSDKVYINQTYLSKHQGSNRTAIKGYLDLNKEVLRKHHEKHQLNWRHNIEVNSFFKNKQT